MGGVRVTRFGEYFLTRRVALGGMAELYRDRKIGPAGYEKLVAIKRLLPHLAAGAEFRTMFLNERVWTVSSTTRTSPRSMTRDG